MHIKFRERDRWVQGLLILGSVAGGMFGFTAFSSLLGEAIPIRPVYALLGSFALVLVALIALWMTVHKKDCTLLTGVLAISALTATGTVMVLITVYQLAAYITLPADLLSFSEGAFVNNILELRLSLPIYTPPQDNNSIVYTPLAPILTYLIAAVLGHGDSIPWYRVVQFSYVVLAAIVATAICDLLARKLLSPKEYRLRVLWIAVWFLFLFLICTDSRFNLYNHSLHNDGLALLYTMSAYWLMVRHSIAPLPWSFRLMAVLPAIGFLIKQNQLMWAGIFLLYLATIGDLSRRKLFLFLLYSITSVAVTVGVCYTLWGNDFIWWTFSALGQKQVSLLRSVQHLLQAGIYVIMSLFGGWILVFRNGSQSTKVLWLCWLLLFAIQTYTSGVAWQANHMGPGIVIAACWFFVALTKVWPTPETAGSRWQYRAQEVVAMCAVVLLFGALGLVREPRNPVPADFFRYVADIEREFQGLAPNKVLMDFGTWVYLKENVLMKDRAVAVAVHVGKNQADINHAMLAATIKRIEEKSYDKILARQLDTVHSAYDFQDRGSGVKTAIFANYHEVRRIPAVQDIEQWWPKHLISEILVLVPNENHDRLLTSPMAASSRPIPPH